MIRAGWVVHYRWFNVSFDAAASPYLVDLPRPPRPFVRIEIATGDPTLPALRTNMPRYIRAGGSADLRILTEPRPVPPRELDTDPPMVWLTIFVTDDFPVDAQLDIAWRRGEAGSFEAAEAAVADGIEPLRGHAHAIAGLCGASHTSSTLERWAERKLYFTTDCEFRYTFKSSTYLLAPAVPVDVTELGILLGSLDDVARNDDTRVPLHQAGAWMALALEHRPESEQAFFEAFRALECLCRLGEPDIAARTQEIAALGLVVKEHAPQLLATFQSLKERGGGTSLSERFSALATRLSPETAADDVRAFKKLNKLRGQLAHGSIPSVPSRYEGLLPANTAVKLGQRYLYAVARRHGNEQ